MQNFTKLAAAALFLTAGLAANAQGLGTATVDPNDQFVSDLSEVNLQWSSYVTIANKELAVEVIYNRNSTSYLYYEDGVDIMVPHEDFPMPRGGFDFGDGEGDGEGDGDGEAEGDGEEYIPFGNVSIYVWMTFEYDPVTWQPLFGEYQVIVPEGMFADEEGNTNAAQTLTYQLVPGFPNSEITFNPLPDNSDYTLCPGVYNRTTLSDVVLSFDGMTITINQKADPISVYRITEEDEDGVFVNYLNSSYVSLNDDYTELHLNLGGYEYGTYKFEMPQGYVILNDGEYINGASFEANTEFVYTVFDGLNQPIVLEAPAAFSVKNQIAPLTLSWDYEMVSFSGKVGNATITYKDKNGEQTIDIPSSAFTWSTENNTGEGQGNVLSIDINSVLKDMTGEDFTITLPEGFVETWDLNVSPATTYSIQVYNLYTDGDPQFTQYEKNILKLSWKNAASYQNVASAPSMYVTNGDTEIEIPYNDMPYLLPTEASVYLEKVYDEDPDSETSGQIIDMYYLINLNKLGLTNGTWTLVAPETWTIISDAKEKDYLNSQASYTFLWDGNFAGQTTGVESLEVEDANAPVVYYNLQGQVVTNPEKGQILIKKQGTKTSKVVY